MKKINENTKVTLTVGQLRKLVKEAVMRDIMELPTSEQIGLLHEFWDALENGETALGSNFNDYCKWLNDKGFNTSNYSYEQFDSDWDDSVIEDEEEKEEALVSPDGDTINTQDDAKWWLRRKLEEYGNTYHFPPEDNRFLDTLIEKYGNTYFWS